MTVRRPLAAFGSAVMLTVTGCAFHGVNSLPLPGALGSGSNAVVYHVELANIGTLESNSPVMIDDVVVGSVGKMTLHGWHIDLDVSIKPDVVVPANAVATVGQTSLLGSMHVALDPPLGQAPTGRLQPGATIGLAESSTYPQPSRRCPRWPLSSTAGDWGRSATSSVTSTSPSQGVRMPSAI